MTSVPAIAAHGDGLLTLRLFPPCGHSRSFMRLAYESALIWQLGRQILEFSGRKPTRLTHLGPASEPKAGEMQRWVAELRRLGRRAT